MPAETDCQDCRLRCRPLFVPMTADEIAFMRRTYAELDSLQVSCRVICGRRQSVDGGRLVGYGLMLDGLSSAHALRMLDAGLGPHRRQGCGIFVPDKSAAAVGTPY